VPGIGPMPGCFMSHSRPGDMPPGAISLRAVSSAERSRSIDARTTATRARPARGANRPASAKRGVLRVDAMGRKKGQSGGV